MTDALPASQIDLNQANVETLITLPGIGQKLAERIIQYREEVHPFEDAIQVVAIKGISETMYRRFADTVTVSVSKAIADPSEAAPAPLSVESKSDSEADHGETDSDQADQSITPDVTAPPEPTETETKVPESLNPEAMDGYYIIQPDEAPAGPDAEGYIIGEPETPEREDTDSYYIIQPDGEAEEAGSGAAEPHVEGAEPQEGYAISPETADHSNFRRPWLLMLVGALLGACLALMLLFSLNRGTLNFENHPAVVTLQDEVITLRDREAALAEELKELRQELAQYDALSTRLQNTETEIKILKQARDALAEQMATLESESSSIATQLSTLEEETAGLGDRVSGLDDQVVVLAEADEKIQEEIRSLQLETGRFDGFLTNLRDLLLAVQGTPDADSVVPTPTESKLTPTSTSTPLPTTATPTPTRTPTPTPTSTSTPAS